jgi:CysZ protein
MQILRGIGAFFEGVRFVFSTRGVWWRAAVPAATLLLVALALSAVGIHFALPWAHGTFGDGFTEKLLATILVTGWIVVSFVLALALARPLSGWALDGIVREQRRALAVAAGDGWIGPAPPESSGLAAMGQSFASSLLGLGAGLPLMAGLTGLGWAFPPAAIATAPLDAVVAALLLAWELLDYPLTLQGMTPAARARWCVRHFGSVLGFGLAASVCFAIPVVGWLALPFGVAGATRLVALDRKRLTAG